MALDMGLARRSGTYTIMGGDWGVDPFGAFAAPIALTPLTYTFSVIPPFPTMNLDGARDALYRVVGPGKRQMLSYLSDDGHERVVVAKCVGVQDSITPQSPLMHTFTVTWERLEEWRDRLPRNAKVWGDATHHYGQVSPVLLYGDNVTQFTGTDMFIPVYADGSDGLPIPTADDTRPRIVVRGPFGGDPTGYIDTATFAQRYTGGGLVVGNISATETDFGGADQPIQFQFYGKLTALDVMIVDPASNSVLLNGQPAYDRFKTPDWQRLTAAVKAGVQNTFHVAGQGDNQVYAANTTQPLVMVGNPSSGTITPTFITPDHVSHTATAISWADTAATVWTKMTTGATPTISHSDLIVTGGPFPSNPMYVGFVGIYVGKRIRQMTIASTLGGAGKIYTPPMQANTALLAVTGNPTGGFVTITATNATLPAVTATTANIPWNATNADVYNALIALPNMNGGVGLSVTGGPLPNAPLTITTAAALAGSTFVANAALTGGPVAPNAPVAGVFAATTGGIGSFSLRWFGRWF